MHVLVAGGAGFIGSHTVVQLKNAGHDVTIVDDFDNSKATAVARVEALTDSHIPLHVFDLCDPDKTEALFAAERFDAVIHFAGHKAVGESVQEPLKYYKNNLDSTFSLLRAMATHGVHRLVFSSSATVYGDESPQPSQETYRPLQSSNPYGWTKVMNEQIIGDVARADGFKVALLRYFNPVGAHASGTIGEDPQGIPNNLMPFISQVAVGRRDKLTVFGDDYDTADGTCERDYIHVEDLAAGHLAALEHIDEMVEPVRAFNLGTGVPTSVLGMIKAFETATGVPIPYEVGPRRAGDLPVTFADPSRARDELGWQTTKSIEDMCADTWRWQSANPQGYPG
ncbi:UDP-glucose 4-epimerase GalE [Calidifontibacter indicus]|uniref:UDP-glucose 4-epimerase n=1 Tax=Calidifontibacter indicus TaxID=419650 RepID=A0A3D9UKD4_9MICO|nr:UDP-glucose 4-epimerase GalE [Calidifontibacter indicus]REF29769.1 UDP-glucose 4-epimerase [Calidifontibacter indicus]